MLKIFLGAFLVSLALNISAGTRRDWDDLANLAETENVKTYAPLPIEDPLLIDFDLPLETEFSSGSISLQNGSITGLSGLDVSLSVSLNPARITVNVALPAARINGRYGADVALLLCKLLPNSTMDILTLEGTGNIFNTQISNLSIAVAIDLASSGAPDWKLYVTEIDIPVSFNTVSITLLNFKVNGVIIPWALLNPILKPTFTKFWTENEDAISAALVPIITEIIKDCSLSDLYQGKYECLNLGALVSKMATCDDEEGSSSPETPEETEPPTEGPTGPSTEGPGESSTSTGFAFWNTGFKAFTLLCLVAICC